MNQLSFIQPEQLNEWVEQAKKKAQFGKLPSYIPLLEQADPNEFAFSIITRNNYSFSVGISKVFPLMSVIKIFSLLDVLTQFGEEFVFQRVGNKASKYAFNSLTQLQLDQGFPRNPMINSGAIIIAGLLPGTNAIDRCENFRLWLNQSSGSNLFLDQAMLDSIRSLPNSRNQALVEELTQQGYLENPEMALDIYQQICCLSGNIIDLAYLGMMLIESTCIQPQNRQIIQDIMTESGLYEESPSFTEKNGFPTKSGVSGTMLSIVPQQGVIACYSPPLNEKGNSIAGLFLIEKIADFLS